VDIRTSDPALQQVSRGRRPGALDSEHLFVQNGEHMFGRILILAAVGILLWAAFARSSDASGPERSYVVQPYDTLWSIASAGYADPRQGVWEIKHRNGLNGATIVPGQVLVLP
jgi:LysM domain